MTHGFSGKAAMNGSNVPRTPVRPSSDALRVGILALPEITGAGIFRIIRRVPAAAASCQLALAGAS